MSVYAIIADIMSEALDQAIKKCVESASEEWNLTYPDYVEMQMRLRQLAFAIPGLASTHMMTLDPEIVKQIEEFRETDRKRMPRYKRAK